MYTKAPIKQLPEYNDYMKASTTILKFMAPLLTGTGISRISGRLFGGRGNILMLHRVVDPKHGLRVHNHHTLEISPSRLEEIIVYLRKQSYNFLSLDQMHQHLKDAVALDPFIVFTFDDGYKDNIRHVYPIFKKYNIPFTIFVTTSFPDNSAIMWWYLLEDFIIYNNSLRFVDNNKEYLFKMNSINQKERTFKEVRSFFIRKSEKELPEFTARILNISSEAIADFCKETSLSWDDLKILAADPIVTIGAHTVTHVGLSNRSTDEVIFEMSESKKLLEKATGKDIHHFSYPFGTKSEAGRREYELALRSGYLTACTTRLGQIYAAHKEYLTALPRIPVNVFTTNDYLELQLSGLISFIKNNRKKIIT